MCCIIDSLSVDIWWSNWWNGPNSSITMKVYTRRTNSEAVSLPVFLFCVLPMHTNIVTDKGFNLFDECAARCVHLLYPLEEECTSSTWGDRKMYTSGSRANLQRMLTEIDKTDVIAKIRIWVERTCSKKVRFFIFWTFWHTFIKGNLGCLSNIWLKNKKYHG